MTSLNLEFCSNAPDRKRHPTSTYGHDGLRDCFRDPIPEIFEAANLVSKAVDAHLAGDMDAAGRLLRQADMPVIGDWLDSIWLGNAALRAVRKIDDLPPLVAKPERFSPREAPTDMKRSLVARDGHHCRLCGIPLVRAEIRKLLNRHYPEAARWTSIRSTDQHRGLQVMWLQYDHVVVHSRGGETTMENIVVTCPACNFGRDRYMMAEVGLRDPRTHPRSPVWDGSASWDGLERILPAAARFVRSPPASDGDRAGGRIDADAPSTRASLDVLAAVVEAAIAGADMHHVAIASADQVVAELGHRFDCPPGDPLEKELERVLDLVWGIRDLVIAGGRDAGGEGMRAAVATLRRRLGA